MAFAESFPRGENDALRGAGGVGPGPLHLGERHGPGVDAEGSAGDLVGEGGLAQRLHARIERSLSPMTGQLALAEQRRLQTLLERLLGSRES